MPSKTKICNSYMMLGVVLFSSLLLVLNTKVANWSEKSTDFGAKEDKMSAKRIEEVLKEHFDDLMVIPGAVVTVQGLCNGRACTKVFVIKKAPQLDRKIPGNLDSHPVVIGENREFRAPRENQQ